MFPKSKYFHPPNRTYTETDSDLPLFPDDFQVAKYSIFRTVGAQGGLHADRTGPVWFSNLIFSLFFLQRKTAEPGVQWSCSAAVQKMDVATAWLNTGWRKILKCVRSSEA